MKRFAVYVCSSVHKPVSDSQLKVEMGAKPTVPSSS